MHKKYFIPFILLILFSFALSASAVNVSAKGACIIEADSQDIVYEKNASSKMSMASTTKIMTAIVVIENSNLNDTVKITHESVGIEGSSIYLKEGEELTVNELLYALLLESANDASVALAIACAGSVDAFVDMMNEKAAELGLVSTSFSNPHGLDDENHYTTPYELSKIALYAMNNPTFREIASTYKKVIPLGSEGSRVLINHNKLLRTYDGAIGVKTGFTRKSGRCLVSCAERDGVELICVTLNAPNDWNDHKSMLDYGFSIYENVTLASAGDYVLQIPVLNGDSAYVSCTNTDGLDITLKKGDINLTAEAEINESLTAPINKGDCVGRIVFKNNAEEVAHLNLYATESVNKIKNKKSFFERIFG